MKPFLLSFILIGALASCAQTTPSTKNSASTAGSGDGEARKLKIGSSSNEAFSTFGPEAGFERNPDNFDETCLSYAYGSAESPRYVHAYYFNNVLSRATDGHSAICTYVPAAVVAG